VSDRVGENTVNGVSMCREAWIEALKSRCGLQCRLDSTGASGSIVSHVLASHSKIVDVDVAWQSVSPLPHGSAETDGRLLVNIVISGNMSIEQHGRLRKMGSGDIAVVDAQARYNKSFREPTRIVLLKISRSALRERGLRYHFPIVHTADELSPDVAVVREFMVNVAAHAGNASDALRARLGDQCLDLMDVLVGNRDDLAVRRSSAVTALRAKQLIARHIGDPELSLKRVAAELNVSISSVTRALKADGLSVMRYAWALRLERAARMLEARQSAIQEIAYQCGFANPAHFSRAFKERYGVTPREYAASYSGRSDVRQH
jgi:AraC-like DNA-binding protein